MDELDRTKSLKSQVWGWFLIAIGVVFLLDRFHVVTLPNIGLLWPLSFVAVAAIHVAERRPPHHGVFPQHDRPPDRDHREPYADRDPLYPG